MRGLIYKDISIFFKSIDKKLILIMHSLLFCLFLMLEFMLAYLLPLCLP